MKSINTGLLISLLLFHPFVSASDNEAPTTTHKDGLGLGIGALIGGLIAGPPGIVIGAASGGFFGAREGNKDQQIAALEKALNQKSLELAWQQNELAKTRASYEQEFQQVLLNREIQSLEKLSQGTSYVIYYKTNESEIKTDILPRIQQLAALIKPYPQIQVRIEGFADARGTDEFNMALSKQRVSHVRAALIQAGIPATRLQTQAFGERQARADKDDREAYIYDRRVTIQLTLDREV